MIHSKIQSTIFNYLKVIVAFIVIGISTTCSATTTTNTTTHQFILENQNTNYANKSIISRYKTILKGLHYHQVIKISEKFFNEDQKRIVTKPFPRYRSSLKPLPQSIPIKKIHFMQNSIWTLFSNNQYNILTTARAIKNHQLNINTLPKISVWQDQQRRIWTLDHRRLAAIILAGNIKNAPVQWATAAEVNKKRYEYTTKNGGTSIILYLTQRLAVIIRK